MIYISTSDKTSLPFQLPIRKYNITDKDIINVCKNNIPELIPHAHDDFADNEFINKYGLVVWFNDLSVRNFLSGDKIIIVTSTQKIMYVIQ
jgi:hypothetical protein